MGDFENISFTPGVSAKGKLEYGIDVTFSEQRLNEDTVLLLQKIVNKSVLIDYTDDCGEKIVIGPMRLSAGSGDSSDLVNLASYSLKFVRTNRILRDKEIQNDTIVYVAVACNVTLPTGGLPGNGTNGGETIETLRIVTFVECEL
jgi:hypothetical protein